VLRVRSGAFRTSKRRAQLALLELRLERAEVRESPPVGEPHGQLGHADASVWSARENRTCRVGVPEQALHVWHGNALGMRARLAIADTDAHLVNRRPLVHGRYHARNAGTAPARGGSELKHHDP